MLTLACQCGMPNKLRAVFKGEGYGFKPPEIITRKFFDCIKNYMLHNMWPLVLGQKPFKCQEKPSGVYKMQQTTRAAGAPPRTPLGELTSLPQTHSWWRGAGCPLPKNPTPLSAFQALGFGPLGLTSPGPEFSNPLRSKILHTALVLWTETKHQNVFCHSF